MRILEGHSGGVRCLAYTPQGQMLASGGEDGVVCLWNLQSGKPRRRQQHSDWVRGIAFSPDGRQLVSVGWDSQLVRSNTATGKVDVAQREQIEQGWSVAHAPDGSILAVGSGSGFIRVGYLMTLKSSLVLRGHSMPVTDVVFSGDSRTLYSAGHDRTVRVWDAIWGGKGRKITTYPDWIRCLALSPCERMLAFGGDAAHIVLASLPEGQTLAELSGHDQPITRLAFMPDGQSLISASRDGLVQIWDVATRQVHEAFDWGLGPLLSLAVAPDGMTAAAGGDRGQILIWDLDG